MPTLGDFIRTTREFFSLKPTVKAPRQRGMINPITTDAPPGGQYYGASYWQDKRKAQLAMSTSWSFSAIQRIALAVVPAEFNIKRRNGEKIEDIPNHPLEILIQTPNPDNSREYLWMHTIYSMYLKAAYWFLYPDSRGDIAEIWPMPFDRVRAVPNEAPNPDSLFAGFMYTYQSGKEQLIPPSNVVYLRFPNPLDPYLPFPPLQAMMKPIITDNAQQDWNTSFIDGGKGLPASIVSVPPELDDGQFNSIKRDLQENVGKRMITRAGTISVEFMQQTHQEMEFLSGREFNRDEIYAALGVPSDITNQDSWRWFINNTVWPVLSLIAGQITTQMVQPYFGDNIFAEFEDIRPQDRSIAVQESVQYSPFRPVNEERATRNEKPLPKIIIPDNVEGFGGLSLYDDIPSRLIDTLLPEILKGKPEPVPPQLQAFQDGFNGPPSMLGSAGATHEQVTSEAQVNPDGEQAQQETSQPQPEQTAKAKQGRKILALSDWAGIAIKKAERGKNPAHVFLHKEIDENQSYELAAVLGLCRTESEVKAVFNHLDEYTNLKATLGEPVTEIPQSRLDAESELIDPLQQWLEAETIRIIQNSRNSEPPDQSFWDNEQKLLLAFILPFVGKWTEAGIAETVTRINTTGLGVDALVNAEAANWANNHALELAKGMTETTRELAKAKIRQWLAGGSRDMAALEQSLSEVIAPRWRVSLVAQTEVSRAFAQARQKVGEALGIVKRFVWVALETACPVCRDLHGRTRLVGGTYPGGWLIPAHPRCRCDEDLLV